MFCAWKYVMQCCVHEKRRLTRLVFRFQKVWFLLARETNRTERLIRFCECDGWIWQRRGLYFASSYWTVRCTICSNEITLCKDKKKHKEKRIQNNNKLTYTETYRKREREEGKICEASTDWIGEKRLRLRIGKNQKLRK